MKIIPDNDTLKEFIPNQFVSATGEPALFEKMASWLDAAEQWVTSEFVGDMLDEIIQEHSVPYRRLAAVTAATALYNAIPSLDLVLTPNGFGVISTSNVAPASKERVDRLRDAVLKTLDFNVDLLLDLLLHNPQWRLSEQGRSFAKSFFMRPADVKHGCSLDEFHSFRATAAPFELRLANYVVSLQIYRQLKSLRFFNPSPAQASLTHRIMDLIRDYVDGKPEIERKAQIAEIVEFIKANPTEFPDWADSQAAKIFNPPIFQNKKSSSAYWF